MKSPLSILAVALGLALLMVVFNPSVRARGGTAAAAISATPASQADAAAGALLLQRCGGCHGLEKITQAPRSAAAWSQNIDQMQAMGAQVTPDEKAELVDYLSRHFGG